MSKMVDAAIIAELLTDRFGLLLVGETVSDADGQRIRLSPKDVARTQGFSIEVLIGWRTIEVDFIPASFAATLVAEMQNASLQQRTIFLTFVEAVIKDSGSFIFTINSMPADPFDNQIWANAWRSVGLKIRSSPIVIDPKNNTIVQSLAVLWAGRLLGLSLALLPLEEKLIGEPEGGAVRTEVSRYERSSLNRVACIEIQGTICKVCGFDFANVYGVIGKGFIEVHHIEPVSGIVQGTIVDPTRDLVPLCANCHAMIHRRKPPYRLEELRSMLQ